MPDDLLILTEAEWLALQHEPPQLLKVYLAMRWHMDRTTGLAGPFATPFFRRALYVAPRAGRTGAGYPTRQAMRSTLAALERLELVRHRLDLGKGIFAFPLAPWIPAYPAPAPVAEAGCRRSLVH